MNTFSYWKNRGTKKTKTYFKLGQPKLIPNANGILLTWGAVIYCESKALHLNEPYCVFDKGCYVHCAISSVHMSVSVYPSLFILMFHSYASRSFVLSKSCNYFTHGHLSNGSLPILELQFKNHSQYVFHELVQRPLPSRWMFVCFNLDYANPLSAIS